MLATLGYGLLAAVLAAALMLTCAALVKGGQPPDPSPAWKEDADGPTDPR